MVRHLLGSFWNHFKLCRSHHRYPYTGGILSRRSQDVVRCGLSFIILPCLFFAVLYGFNLSSSKSELAEASRVRRFTQVFLCGFNPLQALIFYLKDFRKLWLGDKIVPSDVGTAADEEAHSLLVVSKLALMYEATLESAPQFIIQLYAMAVQQESVKIVQMVSLPVSFLSLAWASTIADESFTARERTPL